MSSSSPRLPGGRRRMAIMAICTAVIFPYSVNAAGLKRAQDDGTGSDPFRVANSQSRTLKFFIESQPLYAALIEFSKQSKIQLIFVASKSSPKKIARPERGPYNPTSFEFIARGLWFRI